MRTTITLNAIGWRAPALLQIVIASLFIGLVAQIRIPLPFTPVPLMLQPLPIMLIGALLGPRKGAVAAFLYLVQGWMGAPVFAGGNSGISYFFGPTGGYLAAFVGQAYLIGWFRERQMVFHAGRMALWIFFTCCLQMAFGSIWLAHFVGWKNAPWMGFFPFVPGEWLKALLATSLLKVWRRS